MVFFAFLRIRPDLVEYSYLASRVIITRPLLISGRRTYENEISVFQADPAVCFNMRQWLQSSLLTLEKILTPTAVEKYPLRVKGKSCRFANVTWSPRFCWYCLHLGGTDWKYATHKTVMPTRTTTNVIIISSLNNVNETSIKASLTVVYIAVCNTSTAGSLTELKQH